MKLSWANTAFTSLVETLVLFAPELWSHLHKLLWLPHVFSHRQGFLCSNISGINALLASRRSAPTLVEEKWLQCGWSNDPLFASTFKDSCTVLMKDHEGSCDGRQIKHIRSVNCNFWELWSIYREHEDFQILDSKEGQCKSHKFVKILHLHYILAINISQRQLTATIN